MFSPFVYKKYLHELDKSVVTLFYQKAYSHNIHSNIFIAMIHIYVIGHSHLTYVHMSRQPGTLYYAVYPVKKLEKCTHIL